MRAQEFSSIVEIPRTGLESFDGYNLFFKFGGGETLT